MKIDYKFKSEVLKTDIPKLANQISKAIYANQQLLSTGEIIYSNLDIDTALELRCFLLERYPNEYAEAEKINTARYKRVGRIRNRIADIIHNSEIVQFVTLTFTDEVLAKTTAETRRKYVQRFLTEHNTDYVGNIDFGAKNGREHYHAVIGCRIIPNLWQYGFTSALFVKDGAELTKKVPKRYEHLSEKEQKYKMRQDSEKALSKYIAKLTNHAIKETVKGSRILTPKKPKNRKKKPKLKPFTDLYEQCPF